MKTSINKIQAQEIIDSYFTKQDYNKKDLKKIIRLAMKFKIKLSPYRKLFCKKCFSKLHGKIRVSKTHNTIECESCKYKNKIKYS